MSGAVELLEYVSQPTSGLSVDAEAGVVRNVRVLGLESQNGRRYLPEAVAKAVPLYQRRAVNVDHPERANQATGLGRRVGWLENVRQDNDGGLRGDLYLLTAHPLAPMILEAAVRNPALLGLSHNAHGRTRREGSKEVIEAIDRVNSVDLVADPASVAGLHEGRGRRTMKLRELIECYKDSRPLLSKWLGEVADAGIMPPDAEMAEPPAEAGGDDHEQAVEAIVSLVRTALMSKDHAKAIAAIKAFKKVLGMNGGGGGDSEPPSEEGRRAEVGNLREENARLRAKLLVRKVADDLNVSVTDELLESLRPDLTEAQVRKVFEQWKASGGGGQRPRSATPVSKPAPAGGDAPLNEGKAPTDPKEFTRYATTR